MFGVRPTRRHRECTYLAKALGLDVLRRVAITGPETSVRAGNSVLARSSNLQKADSGRSLHLSQIGKTAGGCLEIS